MWVQTYGLSNKNKTTLNYIGFENTKKQSTKTTVLWICRYVKQFGCRATIITCGDTIIKFPEEHCCRYVPGEVEARKIVAAMKETSLYTGSLSFETLWFRKLVMFENLVWYLQIHVNLLFDFSYRHCIISPNLLNSTIAVLIDSANNSTRKAEVLYYVTFKPLRWLDSFPFVYCYASTTRLVVFELRTTFISKR